MTSQVHRCRLCLAVTAGGGASDALMAVLDAVDVASVVIEPAADRALAPALVRPLVEVTQARGAAALVMNDARLARTLGADGVHLAVSPSLLAAYAEARDILGTRALVGADAGRSRHDAMAAGEAGADYIAFGVPNFVAERELAVKRQQDLVQWWAEIFEVPVVAFDVTTAEWAGAMASAGADFVSLRLPVPAAYDQVRALAEAASAALMPLTAAKEAQR